MTLTRLPTHAAERTYDTCTTLVSEDYCARTHQQQPPSERLQRIQSAIASVPLVCGLTTVGVGAAATRSAGAKASTAFGGGDGDASAGDAGGAADFDTVRSTDLPTFAAFASLASFSLNSNSSNRMFPSRLAHGSQVFSSSP